MATSEPLPPTTSSPPTATYEEEWYLKDVEFSGRRTKIVTQNLNGPCSFIAICNVLLLRGDIQLASQRESVTYEYMAQLVGDYLLTHCPGVDVGAALSIMPLTTRGMDLNPLFTGSRDFRPSGDGGALALFHHASISLVHGWIVDPASPEYAAVAAVQDYDTAENLVAEADYLTCGRLVPESQDFPGAGSSSSPSLWTSAGPLSTSLTPEQQAKVGDAIRIRTFLDNTSSQLTYYGLFDLSSSVQPGQLIALFRNSHLSVLYKPPPPGSFPPPQSPHHHLASHNPFAEKLAAEEAQDPQHTPQPPAHDASHHPALASNNPFADKIAAEDSATSASATSVPAPHPPHPHTPDANTLYLLVTDASFAREPSIVWEALRDVDGQTSAFFDSAFAPAAPLHGDFAGNFEGGLTDQMAAMAVADDHDEQLARQLQAEEDQQAQEALIRRQRELEEQHKAKQTKKVKKKTSCIMM